MDLRKLITPHHHHHQKRHETIKIKTEYVEEDCDLKRDLSDASLQVPIYHQPQRSHQQLSPRDQDHHRLFPFPTVPHHFYPQVSPFRKDN